MIFDDEWEYNGTTYWLRAEVHIPEVPVADHGEYWSTAYSRTIYESGKPEILDVAVAAWNAADQGYDTPVEEPRVLAAARAYLLEYV